MSTPKVILITGASGGIGRACAIALSRAPSDRPLVLVLSGRRRAELEATAEACAASARTEICAGDVTDEAYVRDMFESVRDKWGRVDVLFNNAGIDSLKGVPLENADMGVFRHVLDVNVMAAVLCTAAAIRVMKSQSPRGGRIINNGSISASAPRPDSAAYTVSKHAIAGLTASTSLDGRKWGITATQLDIGNAATDMGGGAAAGCVQADGNTRSEPVMGVENVAKAVVFVAGMPAEADVLHLQIIASGMPFVGRG